MDTPLKSDLRAMAERAIAADILDTADKIVQQYLKSAGKPEEGNWNYGNVVHHAHLIKGMIAFKRGDRPLAIAELLEAGKTPGSPQLNSFGPNMHLAKKLVEVGEQEAVLSYFELCANFWINDPRWPLLEQWTKTIRAGEIPDFKGNLIY